MAVERINPDPEFMRDKMVHVSLFFLRAFAGDCWEIVYAETSGDFPLTEEMAPCAFLGSWASTLNELPERSEASGLECPKPIGAAEQPDILSSLKEAISAANDGVDNKAQIVGSVDDLAKDPFSLQRRLSLRKQSAKNQSFLDSLGKEDDRAGIFSCGGSVLAKTPFHLRSLST